MSVQPDVDTHACSYRHANVDTHACSYADLRAVRVAIVGSMHRHGSAPCVCSANILDAT
jgi:hypothetical protein